VIVKLRKVGNSMTFTLPAEIVRETALGPGEEFDVRWTADGILFTPTVTRWDKLVAESRSIAARERFTERDVLDEIARIRGRSR
jgi:antitoxin component of MazEF toxin-antitoxin module